VAPERAGPGETIGHRLKRLRLERGLSQRELAAPGVSYAYISRIEAGTRQPSVKALRKLAAKLGVSAAALETGSELDDSQTRELRLADLELAVRLGEGDAAGDDLRALLTDAEAAADAPSAFRTRVALATIHEHLGDVEGAIALLEAALAGEPFEPAIRVDAYSQLGRAYAAVGQPRRAVELFEACRAASADDAVADARYAALLSYALTDLGEIAKAEQVVQEALERMRGTEDPYMRVRLYWSSARLATAEGRPAAALANSRKAIALLDTTEDTLGLAHAHVLASAIFLERAEQAKAARHLDDAEHMLGTTPASRDLVEMKVQRSRIARLDSDPTGAVALAREALSIESTEADRGVALSALADALALDGQHEAAGAAYREAVDLLEAAGWWRPAANACRAWGQMLRASGDESQALDVLDRATSLGMRAAPQHARSDR
jgi:transcriptional regulator with XRE-family HTH domain/pyrimidine deaminase RibD-like protein